MVFYFFFYLFFLSFASLFSVNFFCLFSFCVFFVSIFHFLIISSGLVIFLPYMEGILRFPYFLGQPAFLVELKHLHSVPVPFLFSVLAPLWLFNGGNAVWGSYLLNSEEIVVERRWDCSQISVWVGWLQSPSLNLQCFLFW